MTSLGPLLFGDGWAMLRGEAVDHGMHLHAAIQVCVAEAGVLELRAADGEVLAGEAFLVRPLVEHALTAQADVTLLYVEPQSPIAFTLLDAVNDEDIALFDAERVLGVAAGQSVEAWSERLARLASPPSPLDARLAQALDALAERPGALAISDAARLCNLSESRLRALAREALGLPLSTWLVWRKLERATRALAEGEALADAAAVAGFADQAHLSRMMRRMFGVTPGVARARVGPNGER